MHTILLTGFEPFGGSATNSSWEAVKLVGADWRGESRLLTACLPVEFGLAAQTLNALIDESRPDLVIATGVAAGRTVVTPERIAINLAHATIPDNAGSEPKDEHLIPTGPDAYFTGLPVRSMVDRMLEASVPAEVSLSAGTYVCNDTMYRMMHHLAGSHVIAGFIHVPDAAELPVETIARGLRAAIDAVVADASR